MGKSGKTWENVGKTWKNVGKTWKNVGKTWENVHVEKRGKKWENVGKMWKTVGETLENPANTEDLTIGVCWNRLKRGNRQCGLSITQRDASNNVSSRTKCSGQSYSAHMCWGGRATKSL